MDKLRKRSKVAIEKIEAMAQDGIRGIRATQEIMREEEVRRKKVEAWELEKLHSARNGKILTYNRLLAGLLLKRMYYIDWKPGWTYEIAPTDTGVVLEIKSPDMRIFRNAFKPTGEPGYDLNAVETFAVRAENTIHKHNGQGTNHTKNIRS